MKKLVSIISHFASAIEQITSRRNISNCWSIWTLPSHWRERYVASFAVGESSLNPWTLPAHGSVSNAREALSHRSLFAPARNLFLWDLSHSSAFVHGSQTCFLSKKTSTQ